MGQKITVVDAFTEKPFAGNPAAVCILPRSCPEDWMRNVAREMNLSETAFLTPAREGWALRWFTPRMEVELCGHATLASAHVLWDEQHLGLEETARFQTLSGELTASRRGDWIELDFPATPPEPTRELPSLGAALGSLPIYVGKTRFDYLIELKDEQTVRDLRPNLHAMAAYPSRGFIVTARAGRSVTLDGVPYDFVSRFFAPGAGVTEDPVTGSAHCALGPYWAERVGRQEMTGYQCSTRGGMVRVRLEGDRAILAGQAVTVLRGEFSEEG